MEGSLAKEDQAFFVESMLKCPTYESEPTKKESSNRGHLPAMLLTSGIHSTCTLELQLYPSHMVR